MSAPPPVPIDPSEKTWAALVHVAAIPFPFLGPIAGLVIFSKSRLIRFHALSSMISQILMTALVTSISIASISYSIYGFIQNGLDFSKIDWVQLIIKSIVVWAMLGLFALWNIVNGIILAIQTQRNGWPTKFSTSQKMAKKMMQIAPEEMSALRQSR